MHVIQALRRLSALDEEWDEKGRAYQTLRQRLSSASALDSARRSLRDVEEELAAKRSALRNAELELASLQAKARAAEDELYAGRILQPRELDHLRRDVASMKQRVAALEEALLGLMQEVEALDPRVEESREALRVLEEKTARERANDLALYDALRERLRDLQAERVALRGEIEPKALALYEELRRSKGGVPLAAQRDGHCQVCRVIVPAAKAQAVERGEDTIVLCVGCGRILYHG